MLSRAGPTHLLHHRPRHGTIKPEPYRSGPKAQKPTVLLLEKVYFPPSSLWAISNIAGYVYFVSLIFLDRVLYGWNKYISTPSSI